MKINYQHCDQCGDEKFTWLYNRIVAKISEVNGSVHDMYTQDQVLDILDEILEDKK